MTSIPEQALSVGFKLIPPGIPRPEFNGRPSTRLWMKKQRGGLNEDGEVKYVLNLCELAPPSHFITGLHPLRPPSYVLRVCLEGPPNRVVWLDFELQDLESLGRSLNTIQTLYVVDGFETRESFRRRHPNA